MIMLFGAVDRRRHPVPRVGPSRPSRPAARANLFAGLDLPEAARSPACGQSCGARVSA